MRVVIGLVAALATAPALAAEPGQAALDDAISLGTTATLAPLCSLRDEQWAFDLRRAAILRTTGTDQTGDDALRAAPGSALAQGALSYAETEATEDFAGKPPGETCEPLRGSAALHEADAIVAAFRALKAKPPNS